MTTAAGVATFAGLQIDRGGSGYVLVASAPGLDAARAPAFAVAAAPATRLAVQVQPSNAAPGAAFGVQPAFAIVDANGALVAGATDEVSVAIKSGTGATGATLLGATTARASSGVAVFASLRIDAPATDYVLAASAPGLAGVETAPFAVAERAVAQLVVRAQPAGAVAGAPFATQPSFELRDAGGSLVVGPVPVTVAIGAGSGTPGAALLGTTTVAAAGGIATFSGLRIDRAGGAYVLVASAGSASVETAAFDVVQGATASITVVQQPGDAVAGQPLVELRAELRDDGGTLVAAPVVVTARIAPGSGAAGAVLQGTTARASVGGVVRFDDLRIDTAATGYTIMLAVGAVTVESAPFAVAPAAPAALAFTTQPGGGVAGAVLAQQPVVELRDAFGNRADAAAPAVTVALASAPADGALLGATTATATAGVARFATLRADVAGTYTLAASAPGLAGAVSSAFVVAPGAASRLRFETEPGGAVTGAATNATTGAATRAVFARPPIVRVDDAFGNLVTGASGIVTVRIAAGTGTAGATLTGTTVRQPAGGRVTFDDLRIDRPGAGFVLVATASGLTEARSAPFEVALGAPRTVVVRTHPADGVGGEPLRTQPVFELRDGDGNLADGVVTLALKAGAGPAGARLFGTLSAATTGGVVAFGDIAVDRAGGGYMLVASAPGAIAAETATFTVVAGAPARLALDAQPAGGTTSGGLSPQPVVAVLDAGGNRAAGAPKLVRLALKPGSGVVGATLAGIVTLTATDGRAAFAGLSIAVPGAGYVLVASADGLSSVESAPFAVTTGAAGGSGGGGGASATPTATASPTPTPTATTRTQAGGVIVRTRAPQVTTLASAGETAIGADTAGARVLLRVPPRALAVGARVSLAGLDDTADLARQAAPARGETLLAAWVIEALDGAGAAIDGTLASEAAIEVTLANAPFGVLDDELVLAFWDGASWVPLASEVARGSAGGVAVVGVTAHFSLFGVLHAPRRDVAIADGWTLVVWHGADGAATGRELARIRGREPVAAAFRADGAGGWEWHIVGAPPFAQRGLATLRDGHPLLVRSYAPGSWRLPAR